MDEDQYLNHMLWQKDRGLFWPATALDRGPHNLPDGDYAANSSSDSRCKVIFGDFENRLDENTLTVVDKMAKSIGLDTRDYQIVKDPKTVPKSPCFLVVLSSKKTISHSWGKWFHFSRDIRAVYTHHPIHFHEQPSLKVKVWEHLQHLKFLLGQVS